MLTNALAGALTCNLPCLDDTTTYSDSDEIIPKAPHEPVLLNVYDLYKLNEYTTNIGFGIFHSGVEVYGIEYGFAGHQNPHTGIFKMQPRNVQILNEYFNFRDRLKFRETILIGHTNFTVDDVSRIKHRLGRKFQGDKYHLINNNCNHFSGAFTKILCRKNIPGWVNRLAYVSSFIPFVDKLLPDEWIGPSATRHHNLNVQN